MHFIDPVSECSVSVNIRADGITCHEYKPSGGEGNQQCWIAVEADRVLSVQCNAEMAARKYHVDLIVDGILRNTWLSSWVEKVQKRPATIDFSTGIYKDKTSLLECSLRTSSLRQKTIDFDSSKPPTIGTIEIQVSKFDHDNFHRQTATLPMETEKGWNDLPLTLGTAGVPPTHEIRFTNGEKLGESDRKKMRNKMKMPRPGRVPWASFKYYYRLEAFLPLSHDIIDQIGTAALAMKVSEAHPSKSLLSTAKSDTSALIKSGPENPESSRAPSLVPSSSSEEPLSAVASNLQTKDGSNKGESCTASPSLKDENFRPWLFRGKSAEKVEQVRPKIDPQVVSIVAQHKPRSDHTLFDQTRQEPLLPAPNRSLENGPSFASPSPNIHATQRIFPHHLPRPDSLQHVKRNAKEVEALRAKVKELQSEPDEAQRKSKEEQKKTEMLASRLEAEWTELLISKADLECQIVECKNAIATQLREQKELAGSIHETLGDISAGPGE